MRLETRNSSPRSIIIESFRVAQEKFPGVTRKEVREILRPWFRQSTVRDFLPIIAPRVVMEELRQREPQVQQPQVVLKPNIPSHITTTSANPA